MEHAHISNNPAIDAGNFITRILENQAGEPTLFFISGGSSLLALEHIAPDVLGPSLTCMMGDDRFTTDDGNNFSQLIETSFYSQALERGVSFINSSVQVDETHDGYYARLKRALEQYQIEYRGAHLFGLFGVSHDGHTAGIFSKPSITSFQDIYGTNDSLIKIHEPQTEYKDRVTLSPDFILHSLESVILYAAGKQEVLLKLSYVTEPYECPAKILTEHKNCTIFTDAEILGF